MATRIRPLHDNVLVRRLPAEERTEGGIIIPEQAKEKPLVGEVVDCGPGRYTEHGDLITCSVSIGEKVLFSKYSGTEHRTLGHDMLMIRESDILAVLEG